MPEPGPSPGEGKPVLVESIGAVVHTKPREEWRYSIRGTGLSNTLGVPGRDNLHLRHVTESAGAHSYYSSKQVQNTT